MSALFGIMRFDGRPIDTREIGRGLAAMSYRATRRPRLWNDGSVGLGHGHLSMTADDVWDGQPLRDAGADVTLIADLRLDNRRELAATLGLNGEDLSRMADSALLLMAWTRWGEKCVHHLLGDFVFALWDGRDRRLFLGRDPMGQRQLFYYQGRNYIIFGSDRTALWTCADAPRDLSEETIGRMLIHDLSARTGIDGIDVVPGGTVMMVGTDGRIERNAYWRPHADPAHLDKSEAYYIEAYRAVLGEAVACRLRGLECDPGLIFSGGYDSAAVAGLAGPTLAAERRKLVAVTSTMPADYVGTIRHARRWTEMCARDMPHLELHHITRENFDPLEKMEEHFRRSGGAAGPYHAIQDEMLALLAKRGVRLVMDGHGGDYTLNPRGQAALPRYLKTGQWLRYLREFPTYVRHADIPALSVLREHAMILIPPGLHAWMRSLKRGKRPFWDDQPIHPDFARQLIAEGAIDQANLLLASKAKTNMRGQMLKVLERVSSSSGGETQTAQHGMSLTRPFHDRRVVELALAVPEDLYVKNGRTRYLACMALRDIYPPEFQTRWRRNDDQLPDFLRMTKRIEPRLLAEISRMEKKEYLARMVDFSKIRRLLAARGPDDHNSGWEQETLFAVHGFVVARYIEWFRGDNE